MIKFDGDLSLAVGMSAKSKIWKNKKFKWSDLVTRLKEENKTNETLKEFISATKEEQLKIKDVGGYVGGYLRNGRRKPENVVHRQLMTLDIDFAHKDFWEDFTLQFNNAAILHGTHKHCETSPRYRLIVPLSRECTPDEYVATARQVAGLMGIELFDKTTFETNRLMFWPSSPKDVDYYFQFQDGPWVDVDEVLASYADWRDSSLWPTADRELQEVKDSAKKQEDPENKKGIVGAFCRTYSITEAISKFLDDVYISTDIEDRYTYSKGTTSAGLIIYDDKFAYSHHGTDPCGGKLCNAFDLVRIHKFNHLDNDDHFQGQKPKSFAAMEELAREDKAVKKIIATENIQESKYDFSEDLEENEAVEDEDIEWMQELEVDSKGNYLSTSVNLNLIFSHDHRLKKLFRQNDFDGKRYVFGNLPWRKVLKPEPVKNVDYSGVRNYIESIYGISGAMKVEDSMALEFEKNHFHPIIDYLKVLEWDKIQRIDSVLHKYFGAEDSIYTSEAFRKMMVGAVARVMDPGVKFDLVLTLVSQTQGTGKSSFLKAIGKSWFSDTFLTVQGKEAFEQLQGAWLIEMAELSGLKKGDIETIKHFISKQEDCFRPAYARTSETYPRQCVFIATTNESTFLRDPSGNRRFMPVDIHNVKLTENPKLMALLKDPNTIDQLWAEAMFLYRKGEKLYLSSDAEKIATVEQKKHSETDERRGLIEAYLNRLLPENWDTLDLYERRAYLEDPLSEKGKSERVFTCIAEVWCECLGKNKEDMDRYKTREINDILRGLDEWEHINSTRNFKIYGKQKYYARKLD
jgi:predicted P-loop ATPase